MRGADDIVQLRQCREDDTDRVHITLRAGVRPPRPRAFVSSSACGVCSADVLDLTPHQHARPAHRRLDGRPFGARRRCPTRCAARQRGFAKTGGMHAAALATAAGELLWVAEDVGRHNAVDKVVGRALLDGRLPATDHLLVVSSRVSFEIVQKAVAAGVAGIVAVSAPSSLAVDLARAYGLLLAGLVRGESLNIYAGDELISDRPDQLAAEVPRA